MGERPVAELEPRHLRVLSVQAQLLAHPLRALAGKVQRARVCTRAGLTDAFAGNISAGCVCARVPASVLAYAIRRVM
jgi:hypothetical protein